MDSTATINPAFTAEQKEYLQGLFAGVHQRGAIPFAGQLADGRITNDPASGAANIAEAEPSVYGTPVSDLTREELWKYEQDPFTVWDKLVAHANEDKAPALEDMFRFKYHGLFYVAPAQDAFMLRLRVPGGILPTHQLRGLARMAADWGSGRLDLTTRNNVQIREFKPRDIVRVLTTVQKLGMTSRGSGADNIRNITASPLTGLDRNELLDVSALADGMNAYIRNSPDMYKLPRKFNIAFDSGGTVSVVADTNDIGFVAVRVGEGKDVPAGVYFRVMLCGITGHRQFATDCGLLLRPDQAIAVAAAMVRVFVEHGDRTDRKKARLKYLVDKWGVDKFLAEAEKKLAFPVIHFPASESEPRQTIDRTAHLGVHAQRQAGVSYIGVVVPVGWLPVERAMALAEIADKFGTGEIRLTVWQNLLIPNIPDEMLEAAKAALLAAGLDFSAGRVLSGTVACTGSQGCRFAASDTKTHAVVLAKYLDARHTVEQPINLHVTGCSNSCAQHYIGDIGMMGVKVAGEEGYQVVLGGGSDGDQGIGRELIAAIKFADLPPVMDRLFAGFTAHKAPGGVVPQLQPASLDRGSADLCGPGGKSLMSTVPYLPDNAPFSQEQRAWLNGFLAGLYSTTPASAAAPVKPSLKIAVLYASQTGTGEGLAKKVAKELKAKGHQPQVASLEGYSPATLARETHAVLIASTYGEGDAPDPARGFYDLLLADSAPRLDKLEYAVLALGDRNYEHFCKFGVDLDDRLTTLGGARMFPVVQSDVEVDEPFAKWKAALLAKLEQETKAGSVPETLKTEAVDPSTEAGGPVALQAASPEPKAQVHTRSNPYFAPLVEKRPLTHESSSKQTLHLAFSLADSEVHYEAGDACAVVPNNDPNLVGEILNATGLLGSEEVRIGTGEIQTIHAALSHGLAITRLDRKIVQGFAAKAKSDKLQDLLKPEHAADLDRYIYDRGVIDLLHEFPGTIANAVDLLSILPKLTPRLYSISSSPAAHVGEVHSTVAVVRYNSHSRERGGICSTMLADRTGVGDRLPIYIQPNRKFRLPASDVPLIMIGPGTGVAPFRSFLHERRALGATGKNWLFFGERSAATDFLYRDELTAMHGDRHLTRLDTAFSRDQAEKIYVQDRMREHGAELWKWLNEGAGVYVCGDASRMAKDVDAALHSVVAMHGGRSEDAAKDYVGQLHEDRRYHRDVY